jgi:hypothetical protein
MNYEINTGLNYGLPVRQSSLESLVIEFSDKLDNLLNYKNSTKLVFTIDGTNNGKEIILSCSFEEWNSMVYLLTKGNDLIKMAKKLFETLIGFFNSDTNKDPH